MNICLALDNVKIDKTNVLLLDTDHLFQLVVNENHLISSKGALVDRRVLKSLYS